MNDEIKAAAFPLDWPKTTLRTPRSDRKVSRFHSDGGALSVAAANRRLKQELKQLFVGDRFVVSTNQALRRDGEPLSSSKAPDDPGVAVYFVHRGRHRVMCCDAWSTVAGNIAAIAAHIDAVRAQLRYKVGTVEQAFAGFALPPASTPPSPTSDLKRPWREVLGFEADWPKLWAARTPAEQLEFVDLRRRDLAFNLHPDRGGSAEEMVELNLAVGAARAELGA